MLQSSKVDATSSSSTYDESCFLGGFRILHGEDDERSRMPPISWSGGVCLVVLCHVAPFRDIPAIPPIAVPACLFLFVNKTHEGVDNRSLPLSPPKGHPAKGWLKWIWIPGFSCFCLMLSHGEGWRTPPVQKQEWWGHASRRCKIGLNFNQNMGPKQVEQLNKAHKFIHPDTLDATAKFQTEGSRSHPRAH